MTLTDDRSTLQWEWLRVLHSLETDIRGWCDAHGWAVHVIDKPITESMLGEYSAPTFQVRAPNGTVIYVEPVARYVAGPDGLVDIYGVKVHRAPGPYHAGLSCRVNFRR